MNLYNLVLLKILFMVSFNTNSKNKFDFFQFIIYNDIFESQYTYI